MDFPLQVNEWKPTLILSSLCNFLDGAKVKAGKVFYTNGNSVIVPNWAGAIWKFKNQTLKRESLSCGRAVGVAAIFEAMRTQFGLPPRQDRAELNGLKIETYPSLQKHPTDIERIVKMV